MDLLPNIFALVVWICAVCLVAIPACYIADNWLDSQNSDDDL